MITKEISVNVSKKIGRTGTFGSDMVSASITVSVDDETEVKSAFVESWAKAWEEVDKQEHEIQDRKEMEDAVKETIKENEEWLNAPPSSPMPVTEPTLCPIHKVPMQEHDGKFGKFYSHSELFNGVRRFCNSKGYKGV